MNIFNRRKKVVTRMAPSPTGHLHIGTARTALFNYLYAKNMGGSFYMRIEDTDKERSTEAFTEEIIEGLAWLGLSWDGLIKQSDRSDVYAGYIEQALRNGSAYVSREPSKKDESKEVEVIRLKNPNKTVTFEDAVRGEISFDTTELGDFVIARGLNDALYHLAVVIDDHEMEVSHVIRGDDHISNTPRQILIGEALGFSRPIYAHLPLILAPDRSKLSKRHGAVALKEYRGEGYLPEAIVNFLALLGWNPGTDQELFTLEELVREFDISGIQKAGAVFNIEKLRWFNKEHMRKRSLREHNDIVFERLPDAVKNMPQFSEGRFERLVPTIMERISVPSDVTTEASAGEYDFAFKAPTLDLEMLKWKKDASVRDALPRLQKIAEMIAGLPEENTADEIKARLWGYAEEVGRGEVLWPLRVALTGKERSPDPFTVMHIIGTGEAYKRVQHACDTILRA